MPDNNILITGGSGYLGRGIMYCAQKHDQLSCWKDAHFIVYSRDETKQDECRAKYPNATYVLGDVKDYDRLDQTMRDKGVTTVIHTGAIKYIPEAEFNVQETIDVNVHGSRNVLHAAWINDVPNVVGISTDKACRPQNVYGISKALMERLWGEYARNSNSTGQRYTLCRYGNVLGSTGSVVPKFRGALRRGEHIKLTNGLMTRYWIGVDEAVYLIEEALNPNVLSGSIIIPKPRSSFMSTMVGFLCEEANVDVAEAVEVIGMRPGEKMHEELMHEQESVRALTWPTYYELRRVGVPGEGKKFALSSAAPEGGWLTSGVLFDALSWAERI